MDPQEPNIDNQPNNTQPQPPQQPQPISPQPVPATPPAPIQTPSTPPANPGTSMPSQPQPVQPDLSLSGPQPVTSNTTGGNFSPPPKTGKLSTKSLIAIIIGVALFVIGAILIYLFAIYLPNTPDNVFKSSMKNSAKAVNGLTNYMQTTVSQDFNTTKFEGKLNLKSPEISMDGTFDGKIDKKGNGSAGAKVNVMGQKVSADLISVNKDNNLSPDVYFKVEGGSGALDQLGLSSINDKWVRVDHTLIDSAMASAQRDAGVKDAANTMPTKDEIFDAINKVNEVNEKYLFSTNPETAVIKNDKFVGTEDGINHYQVSIDRGNADVYEREVREALDRSKLNDWYKKSNSGKNISESSASDSSSSSSRGDETDFKLDLYVDKSSKTIRSFSVIESTDKGDEKLIITQINNGDEVGLKLEISDAGSDNNSFVSSVSVNPKTNKFSSSTSIEYEDVVAKLDLSATLSNEKVDERAPAGAIDLLDLMGASSSYRNSYGGGLNNGSALYGGQYNFTQ